MHIVNLLLLFSKINPLLFYFRHPDCLFRRWAIAQRINQNWREGWMVSSGYFQVSEKILLSIPPDRRHQFLWEMFTHGGRIGYHEYLQWVLWLKEKQEK